MPVGGQGDAEPIPLALADFTAHGARPGARGSKQSLAVPTAPLCWRPWKPFVDQNHTENAARFLTCTWGEIGVYVDVYILRAILPFLGERTYLSA